MMGIFRFAVFIIICYALAVFSQDLMLNSCTKVTWSGKKK